jgi:hypothetical protein
MSKFTKKAIMFAMLIVFGSGHVSASQGCLKSFQNCFINIPSGMRHLARDFGDLFVMVRKAAPEIHAAGTEAITIAEAIAIANGDKEAADALDVAQTILDGAATTIQADNVMDAIKAGGDTIIAVDPNARDDIEKINDVIKIVTPVVNVVAPLIDKAVANTGSKTTA